MQLRNSDNDAPCSAINAPLIRPMAIADDKTGFLDPTCAKKIPPDWRSLNPYFLEVG